MVRPLCLSALVALAVACVPSRPPVDPTPPADRDGAGTLIGEACSRLRALGCPEGFQNRRGRTCFETFTTATQVADAPVACLAAALTIDGARACGDANTIRVRCVLPSVETPSSSLP